MKKSIKFLVMIGIMICTALCSVFIITDYSKSMNALSENSVDALCKEYTKTKTPNGLRIKDYVDEFKVKAETDPENDVRYLWQHYNFPYPATDAPKGNYFQNNTVFSKSSFELLSASIDGDDNITKIVPRELFTYENEKIYIGDVYGFYINTFQRQGTAYFESTVILIDVIRENQDDYAVSVKIQPMAKIDYCFVKNNQRIQFKGYGSEDYSNGTCYMNFNGNFPNAVIPMIRNDKEVLMSGKDQYFMQYKESASFYLSDISFTSRVYNNNSLNYGDPGYNISNDYGYFFNGDTYEYSATRKKTNGDIETAVTEIGLNIIDTAVGFVPVYGNIYAVSNSILGVINSVNSVGSEIEYNTTNKNYYHPETILPPTRQGQLSAYGNLIKYSQMIINSGNDKLLFESNDYAKGTFKLSHTDRIDGLKEYTSLLINVAVKVIDNKSGQAKCLIANTNAVEINEPEIKNIELLKTYSCFIVPGLKQKFAFTSEYSGSYIFQCGNSDVDSLKFNILDSNDKLIFGSCSANEPVELNEGKEYIIDVYLQDENSFGIFDFNFIYAAERIFVNNPAYKTILANDYIVLEFKPDVSSPYLIQTFGADVELMVLSENLSKISNPDYSKSGENAYINALFTSNDKHFIYIKNKSDLDINVNIQIEFPKNLILNQNDSVNLEVKDNFYYKFVPKFSGNYTFTTTGSGTLSLYSNGLNLLINGEQSLSYNLIEKQAYYLKVKSDNSGEFNQKAEFMPNEVKFGDNTIYNSTYSAYTFYSFKSALSGEYIFNFSNNDAVLKIYDGNLNFVEKIIKGSIVKLGKDQKYYIQLSNADILNLNISLNTNEIVQNQDYNFNLNSDGWFNLFVIAPAEGEYIFKSDGNISGISVYNYYLYEIENSSQNVIKVYLQEGQNYYIQVNGNSDGNFSFVCIFDPVHLMLNNSALISDKPNMFFTYIAESNNILRLYTIGNQYTTTEIAVYDSDLSLVKKISPDAHAELYISLNIGERYFIRVGRIAGVSAFRFVIEDLTVLTAELTAVESSDLPLTIDVYGNNYINFKAAKTGAFELRVYGLSYYTFDLELFDKDNNRLTRNIPNIKSLIKDYEVFRFFFDFIKGHEYFITIISLNQIVMTPILSVVVPATNMQLKLDKKIDNDSRIVRQGQSYQLNLETNAGISSSLMWLFKITEGNEYAVIDDKGFLIIYSNAKIDTFITVSYSIDFLDAKTITFVIKYQYDLASEISDAEKFYYRIYDKAGNNFTSLPDLVSLYIEVYEGNNRIKSLTLYPNQISSSFVIKEFTTLAYKDNLIIKCELTFLQDKKFTIPLNNVNYNYPLAPDLLNNINVLNRTRLIIDATKHTGTATINITVPDYIVAINIKGNAGTTYKNIRFDINKRDSVLVMNLHNFSFTAPASYDAINCGGDLIINVSGTCKVYGGAGNNVEYLINGGIGIWAKNLTIMGESLEIFGGSGGTGTGAIHIGLVYEYGYKKFGKPGGNGGRGISCTNLTINLDIFKVTGGNGGTGAVGDTGFPGFNAGSAGYAGYDGEKGWPGGVGGNGAYGIYCTYLNNLSADKIVVIGGNGGTGGKGGQGGTGGNGANGNDGGFFGGQTNGGDGGKGGKGGKGGAGGNGYTAINSSAVTEGLRTITNGSIGSGGAGGAGGFGGTGGIGGSGFWAKAADGITPPQTTETEGKGNPGTLIY